MANILITGANGQLGKEITFLSDAYQQDTFFFASSKEVNICDEIIVKDYLTTHEIDIVINCAAYTKVDDAEDHQELANEINHLAVAKLSQICESRQIKLIHISTDYVFNGENNVPYKTSDTCAPINIYGKSKYLGEQSIKKRNAANQFVIRTSWVYSPFGNNFVKTMLRLGEAKKELSVVDDQIGSPTNARDLAQFLLNQIVPFNSKSPMVLHYTNSGICSWYDFAVAIMNEKQLNCFVRPVPSTAFPTKSKRPHFSVLDKSELTELFHYTPPNWMVSLKESLENNHW